MKFYIMNDSYICKIKWIIFEFYFVLTEILHDAIRHANGNKLTEKSRYVMII